MTSLRIQVNNTIATTTYNATARKYRAMQSAKVNYATHYSSYLGSHSSVLISKLSNANTDDEAQQTNTTTSVQTEYYLNISISFSLQDCGSQCIFFFLWEIFSIISDIRRFNNWP